jgi:glucose/arabinose dehydrogenase
MATAGSYAKLTSLCIASMAQPVGRKFQGIPAPTLLANAYPPSSFMIPAMSRNTILLVTALLILTSCTGAPESEPAGAAAPVAADPGFTLPEGFTATLFAEGLTTPRHIVVNDNGDVYVTLRSGQAKFRSTDEPGGVAALRDTDGDGVADTTEIFGTPDIDTGLAIHDGYIYYSSMTTIYASALGDDLVPTEAAEVVIGEIPVSGSGHRTKPITFDTDGNPDLRE